MRVTVRRSAKKALKRAVLFSTAIILAVALIASIVKVPTAKAETSWAGGAWSMTSVGFGVKCGISAGSPYCWGSSSDGALGNGSAVTQRYPTPVLATGALSGKTVTSIKVSKGAEGACALTTEGKLYCWGSNDSGQIGDGTTDKSSVPVAVMTSGALAGKTISDFSVGGGFACALTTDNGIYCWGGNILTPTAIDMSGALNGLTVSSLRSGNQSTCVIGSNQRVYCWGSNGSGQLGNGSTTTSTVPVAVSTSGVMSGKNIAAIGMGVSHACAIDTAGAMYCWGQNNDGQLGGGSVSSAALTPQTFNLTGALTGKTVQSVTGGSRHTCVIASDSRAYCVGRNLSGQLGNDDLTNSLTPVAVSTSGELGNVPLSTIEAANSTTCTKTVSGEMYCWGGDTSATDSTPVSSPYKIVVRPTPNITGVSFSVVSGHNVLSIQGTGFPSGDDTERLVQDPLISLNGATTPFCNFYLTIGLDKDAFIAAYASIGVTVDPALISDTSTCYQIQSVDPDTSEITPIMTATHAEIALSDSFNITAQGTVSMVGSNEFTFNATSGTTDTPPAAAGGSSGGGQDPSQTTTTTITTTTATSDSSITVDDRSVDGTPEISSKPTFSGYAEPFSTVTVTIHSDPVTCTTTADSTGYWTCTFTEELPPGKHTVFVKVVTPDNVTTEYGPYDVVVQKDMAPITVTSDSETKDNAVSANNFQWPWVLGAAAIVIITIGIIIAVRRSRQT